MVLRIIVIMHKLGFLDGHDKQPSGSDSQWQIILQHPRMMYYCIKIQQMIKKPWRESKHWWKGLVKEYDGFHEIKTWKLTKCKDAKLGNGNWPLTTKNVYKKKVHAITKEPCYQVRNCIRGFDMISGIHYDASFAPTPTNTTVKVVFAITLYYLQQLGPRATMETLE
jgi:hypothetical protein